MAISKPCCPDSMTKFLLDIFSDKDTAGLFYTTDMMVLIDIVARQLADLGPEEEVCKPHTSTPLQFTHQTHTYTVKAFLARPFNQHTHTHTHTHTQTRVHYLELLFRIVTTTDYAEHKHRQHEIIASLNRIAKEENAEGTPDYELVKKIWRTYPEIFEEITDL